MTKGENCNSISHTRRCSKTEMKCLRWHPNRAIKSSLFPQTTPGPRWMPKSWMHFLVLQRDFFKVAAEVCSNYQNKAAQTDDLPQDDLWLQLEIQNQMNLIVCLKALLFGLSMAVFFGSSLQSYLNPDLLISSIINLD